MYASSALAVLLLTVSAPRAVNAQCSLADDCNECLNIAKPSSAKFCSWFEASNMGAGYCEEGCGMDGCGATVCAADIATCEQCLGGPGFSASGQYSWVPEDETCYPNCDEAPMDVSCFKGKSSADPTGYDPSICDELSGNTCPKGTNTCDFEPTNPYLCGPDNCPYENICLAEDANWDLEEDCCQDTRTTSACVLVIDPVTCGADGDKQCEYDNQCLAIAAGYTEDQCFSSVNMACASDVTVCPTGEVFSRNPENDCEFPRCPCKGYGNCKKCLDATCSYSPDDACLETCMDAPADGACYSPEYGHTAKSCPAETACASDVLICPTGESYNRDPDNNCQFPRCPCDGFDTCTDCLEAKCAFSPDAGSNGACLESCDDAPADGECYSPKYGHDAGTCPTTRYVWEQAAPALVSRKLKDYFGSENQLDASGTRFLVSAKKSSESGLKEAGMVKVFDIRGENFVRVGQTLYGFYESDEIQGVLSGSGKRLVMFTQKRDDSTGRVWVYELRNGQWVEIGKILGQNEGDRFGQTAAISKGGGMIAVGVSYANNKKGAVRVYRYQGGTTWAQMGPDIDGQFVDGKFGWDIAFASDANNPTIVVGQKSDDAGDNSGRSGQVRVFRWNSNKLEFRQVGEAVLGDNPGDSFGRQVTISANGKIFAAGARYHDGNGKDSGEIMVFENQGSGFWSQIPFGGADIVGDGPNDQFMNVAMNAAGDRIAGGGGSGDGQVGYVIIYDKTSNGWKQTANKLSGQTTGENFGKRSFFISCVLPELYIPNHISKHASCLHPSSTFSLTSVSFNNVTGSNLSLSPDGNTLLVGSPSRDNSNLKGSVRLYKRVPAGTYYAFPHVSPEIQSASDTGDTTRDATTSSANKSKYTSSLALVAASIVAAIPALYV